VEPASGEAGRVTAIPRSAAGRPAVCHLAATKGAWSARLYYKEAVGAARLGYSVRVIAPGTALPTAVDGVDVRPLPPGNGRVRGRQMIRLARAGVSARAAVIHAHDLQSLLSGVAAKLLAGGRLLYDAHEDYPMVHSRNLGVYRPRLRALEAPLRLAMTLWERALLTYVDAVVTVDPSIASKFGRRGRSATVVRNFAWRDEVSKIPLPADLAQELAGRFVFVYLGALTRQVDGIQLLEALAGLRDSHSEVHLLFIGGFADDEYEAQFAARIRQLSLSGQVTVIEEVAYPAVQTYLQLGNVGLITYGVDDNYGDRSMYPHKLCDYIGAGLPLIVSDFKGLRSVTEPLGIARFVTPGDLDSLQGAMSWFLDRRERTEELRETALALRDGTWNWENELAALDGVYRRLGATSGAPLAGRTSLGSTETDREAPRSRSRVP
jgi:glycosyltransferase involved in cell wall biosynthesis